MDDEMLVASLEVDNFLETSIFELEKGSTENREPKMA